LKSCFLCSKAVSGLMKKEGGGAIINVTSIEAEIGGVGGDTVAYVASKAGVIGFTRALARALGPDGIRVNAVMPGAIRTEGELKAFPDQEKLADFLYERQSLKLRGEPLDIASAFVYLASEESRFVTGTVLSVD